MAEMDTAMWELAQAQTIGGRDEQQDRAILLSAPDGSACLLALADGMGGHRGGAAAAETVTEIARRTWAATPCPIGDPERFLERLSRAAHDAIAGLGLGPGHGRGPAPGSTAVFLYVDPQRAAWCHVGDSRLYLFRNGELIHRTKDHSLVQLLVDIGEVAEADMAYHPAQNRLMRSLGGGGDAPEPSCGQLDLTGGDAFLLCSDGVWETIFPDEMIEALAQDDLERAADGLAAMAEKRGGARGDNATVVLARPRLRGAPAA